MPRSEDNLYACISQFRRPDKLQEHFAEHMEWLREQDSRGHVVVTGASLPLGSGGVQIFAAANMKEMEAIIASDPLSKHGVAANWIFEIQMNKQPDRSRLMDHFFGTEFAAANAV